MAAGPIRRWRLRTWTVFVVGELTDLVSVLSNWACSLSRVTVVGESCVDAHGCRLESGRAHSGSLESDQWVASNT